MGDTKPVVIYDSLTDTTMGVATDGGAAITHNKTLANVAVNATAVGDNTIVALSASQKIKVFSWEITGEFTSAQVLKFESNAGGTLLAHIWLRTDAMGAKQSVMPPTHLFETTAGHLLNLENAGGEDCYVNVGYWKEA